MKQFKLSLLLVVLLLSLSSCGLTTSDAERISMAEASIEEGDYRAATIQLRSVLGNDPNNLQARLMLAKILVGLNDIPTAEKEMQRASELGATASQIQPLHFSILAARAEFQEILAALSMDADGLTDIEQFRFRGDALLGLRNGSAAQENYRDWLEAEPGSVEAEIGFAKSRALQDDVAGATSRLNDILAADDSNSEAWLALAIIKYRQGDYAKARESYRQSIDLSHPQQNMLRYVFSLIGLADSELMIKDVDAARRTITRLTAYAPDAPETMLQRARLAQLDGDYFAASRALQDLLQVSPDNGRVMLLLGSLQWRVGNIQQAESLLNRVVALSPDNAQARKMLAQIELRRANTDLAVEILEPLLALNADDAELYGLLAIADMQRGQSDSALARLRTASQRNPGDRNSEVQLAEGYIRTGDAVTAIEILSKLPMSSDAPYQRELLLMAAYRDIGQLDDAFEIADQLVAANKGDNVAINLAATFYLSEERMDIGRKLVQQAMEQNPNNLQTRIMMAKLDLRDRDVVSAKGLFEGIYQSDSGNMTALLGLAQIAMEAGDMQVAITFLERAREIHPAEPLPALVLANVYAQDGKMDQAIDVAQQLGRMNASDLSIIRSSGGILFDAGVFAEAAELFELATKNYPQSVGSFLDLARSYMSQDKFAHAQVAIQQALELDPNSVPANSLLVLVELQLGDSTSAAERAAILRQNNPGNASAALIQGEVLLANKDYDAAITAFQAAEIAGAGVNAVIREVQALVAQGTVQEPTAPLSAWIEKNPTDVRARMALAETYQNLRAHDRARSQYEALLEYAPQNATVLNNLAWEYQYAGDLRKALQHATDARRILPSSGAIADTLGWIYHSMGDYENSVKHLRDAANLIPDNMDVLYHLAASLAAAGVTTEAKDILSSIVQSNRPFESRNEATALLATL